MLALSAFGQQQTTVIGEILIRGNKMVSKDAIMAAIRTKVGQPYVQDQLDRDRKSLDDLGFFSAVDVRAIPLDAGKFQVVIDLQEFPIIKEIRITGNVAVKSAEIMKVLTIKPGEVFNLRQVNPTATAVKALYTQKGFFGQVEDFGPLKDSLGTISLSIIETKVGTVAVQGNRRTKDYVMRRLIKTRTGEPLSSTKVGLDIRRLYNTQWFETVRTIDDDQRELGVLDITYDVKEARTGTFNIGLQVDPRSSFAGVLKLSESNLRGTGQSVGVDFIQATRGGGPSIDLSYGNPFIDRRDTVLNASIYSRLSYRFADAFGSSNSLSSNSNDFTERRTGGSLGLSRSISDALSVGISGRYERVKTHLGNAVTVGTFIRQDGDVGVLTFGGNLNRRDFDVDPSRGDFTRLEIEPGYSKITEVSGISNVDSLGSHTFVRGTLEYRRYWSKGPARPRNEPDAPRKVLAFKVKLGAISGQVPFFEQYFAGGAETLRGYEDDRFWGKRLILTTLEYRYPLQRSFNAIAFVDYGGAWGGYGTVNSYTQSNANKLHLGYGVGLSFRTPLGPIRLDLGFSEKGKSRTHFLIGTSF